MVQIYPSVMARNQEEIDQTLKKMRGVAKTLHFDVGDGNFVPRRYGWFTVKLSKQFKYNAHLMTSKPENWIKRNGKNVHTIIFHPEPLSEQEIGAVMTVVQKMGKNVGLALKPETKASTIREYLPRLDYVLVLTVHPGSYGARYLSAPLRKIAVLKRMKPNIKVIVDGGIRPETMNAAVQAGADAVVSGSFVTRADDPKKAMRELRSALNHQSVTLQK
ncbi:hypothetical protein HY496_01950 [Candidatus Woesearchaeota archaeon]|nr:hypothetical protein [Candidatus Woesearchaeota archaeon]